MVEVTIYYNMRKDVNSTARPGDGDFDSSAVYPCELFEPCSIINPILKLEVNGANLKYANYAYIEHFARYYWITDIHYERGYWYLHLNVDVLASWRNEIGASEQYILRSESAYDGEITDTLYVPTGARVEQMRSTGATPFATTLNNGTFVLGITTGESIANSTVGTTTYCAMNATQLSSFLRLLWGDASYLNLSDTDLDLEVAKIIINPLQYIQSIKWFPFTIPNTGAFTPLRFGWWALNIQVNTAISNSFYRRVAFDLELPRHPQAAERGGYLNRAPYSTYCVELPVIGILDLPAERIANDLPANILCDYRTDIVTGLSELTITQQAHGDSSQDDRSQQLLLTTCEMGVDIPLAQIARDVIGGARSAASGAVSGLGSMLTGNIMGGISTLVNGAIDGITKATTPIPSFMGNAGNMTAIGRIPRVHAYFQYVTEDATSLFGRPLCQKRVINTLSGFIMCGRAHMLIPGATAQEIERIESYLNGGFRYE